jgi:hypothetical protein
MVDPEAGHVRASSAILAHVIQDWRGAVVMPAPLVVYCATLMVLGASIGSAGGVAMKRQATQDRNAATAAVPPGAGDEVETCSRDSKIIFCPRMFVYGYFWTSLFEQSRGGSSRITKVLLGR